MRTLKFLVAVLALLIGMPAFAADVPLPRPRSVLESDLKGTYVGMTCSTHDQVKIILRSVHDKSTTVSRIIEKANKGAATPCGRSIIGYSKRTELYKKANLPFLGDVIIVKMRVVATIRQSFTLIPALGLRLIVTKWIRYGPVDVFALEDPEESRKVPECSGNNCI